MKPGLKSQVPENHLCYFHLMTLQKIILSARFLPSARSSTEIVPSSTGDWRGEDRPDLHYAGPEDMC